jgi:hypothetical protein
MAGSGFPKKREITSKAVDIPEEERDYYLERRYPAFGNLVPRDVLPVQQRKDVMKGMV